MEDQIKKTKEKLLRCCESLEQIEVSNFDRQPKLDMIFDIKETLLEEVESLEKILNAD